MKSPWLLLLSGFLAVLPAHAEFKAGAAIIDVTPIRLPVLVNGGMFSRYLDKIKTRVHARALVVADDRSQAALVVVDSCMMGRPLLDEAKTLAAARTGIPTNRILISATHAHSAPASMGCLGTDADAAYVPFLIEKLVEVIASAQANLEPARIGFAKTDAGEFNASRQWIRRPDRLAVDPFGNLTVRANMHAGGNWDDVTGEAGPKDPDLCLISVQSRDGRPLAVLGNFSMHYFSDENISADYFGLFAEGLQQRLVPVAPTGKPPFVGMMSHGCSGDIWRRDYTKPASAWNPNLRIEDYANGLLELAMKALAKINYRTDVDIAMAEQRMILKYRVPDRQRLEWAQQIVAIMGNRAPKTEAEVYAREQILLHERQQTEIVLQALRVGEIAIAAVPTETYAITGLKIKAASPLAATLVIELANGGDGYIPPTEHHLFGGYNTWAARSAGLEVQAEPKIVATAIGLLEQVTGRPHRSWKLSDGPAVKSILDSRPLAYWRLNEFTGPEAIDTTGRGRNAIYEAAITYYLEGAKSSAFSRSDEPNRAPHFVGGRLRAQLPRLANPYSIALWIWNGMPNDGRAVSGWFFSRGNDYAPVKFGDHLGIGGRSGHTGKLIFATSADTNSFIGGRTEIPRWTWQHVALTRSRETVRVYLNGQLEFETKAPPGRPSELPNCFFGGRSDNDSNWEGRLDEIAVFDRALDAREIARLHAR